MAEAEEVAIPLQPVPPSDKEQFYRSIFDRADTDGDGSITIEELNAMIRRDELTEQPLPDDVLKKILQVADTNHDGQLDFHEFVGMINNPKFKHIFGHFVNRYVNFVVPRRSDDEDLYRYSCWPPKVGMVLISLVELVFFLIDEFTQEDSAMGPMAQLFLYDPKRRYEAWRYLTYMFVHIGYLHLTVNLVVQIFLGSPLEMVHGWWRVLVIYFTGVVAGSLGTSIADPATPLAGASGGVYSLITAHIATIILNWAEMSFPAVQLCVLLIITTVDVGTSIYNRYGANVNDNVGYIAHFAGAVAGLLVGISVLRNLKVTWKENVIWWIAAIAYTVLMVVGILWNIFYGDYFPTQQ